MCMHVFVCLCLRVSVCEGGFVCFLGVRECVCECCDSVCERENVRSSVSTLTHRYTHVRTHKNKHARTHKNTDSLTHTHTH